MHDNTAIGGRDGLRKPWNLGFSPYRNENDSLFDSFLVGTRYKLLPRDGVRPLKFFAGALLLAIVTLVILCEPDLKFSL